MKRVLILEDEPKIRNRISSTLIKEGYVVAVAKDPVNAIDLGSHFRPNIFVTSNDIQEETSRANISEALRVIYPDLKTILLAPKSAVHDKKINSACRVVEKPVSMAYLRHIVNDTIEGNETELEVQPFPVGVVEMNTSGVVSYANAYARRLFREGLGDSGLVSMCDVFSLGTLSSLISQPGTWQHVSSRTSPNVHWHIAFRKYQRFEGGLLLILPESEASRRNHPVVRTFLFSEDDVFEPWSFSGKALIIDSNDADREMARCELAKVRCAAHTSANVKQGMEILRSDSAIQIVLISEELAPADEMESLVQSIHAIRPSALIVLTCRDETQGSLTSTNPSFIIKKPWDIDALREIVLH